MILIIGGAYQGKLDHALSIHGDAKAPVFSFGCDGFVDDGTVNIPYIAAATPDEARILHHMERHVLALFDKGEDPVAMFAASLPAWQGKILLMEDISCGVVPIDARMRAWREANGRCMALLARHAGRVDRVFCGLAVTIKPCG